MKRTATARKHSTAPRSRRKPAPAAPAPAPTPGAGQFTVATATEVGRRGGIKGGAARTPAKAATARQNGAKGGRPPVWVTTAVSAAVERFALTEPERLAAVRVLRRGADLTAGEWDALAPAVQAAADWAKSYATREGLVA